MHKHLLLLFFIFCFSKQYAQFQFSGKISDDYKDAIAYLSIVKDYKKTNQFIAENVLATSKINEQGEFLFTGNFLTQQDNIYKIYIDNCNENITNAKHLLNQCLDYTSINFIANNNDNINFPLNNLNQMLCDFTFDRKENTYIKQIDSLQESLLINLENTINDAQRKLIYKNYFSQLKTFSTNLKHPVAELYAFNLYANQNSFSRAFYLKDLKKSGYYNELGNKLELNELSDYAYQLKNELLYDNTTFTKNNYNFIFYLLIGLLLISLFLNYFLYKKNKSYSSIKPICYKETLTKQEQRVFEEMNSDLTNKEIADKLFISLSTVKTHINNIYSKLKISSRKEIGKFFTSI